MDTRRLIAGEILKIRTTRSYWGLVIGAASMVLIGVSGVFASGGNPADPETTMKALSHTGVISTFSLILGIMAVAGEYRHRTITDTYLGVPRRGRVLAAKLLVYSALGGVIGLLGVLLAVPATAIWLAAKDAQQLDLGDQTIWKVLLGGILWNVAFAAIGVGIGAMVRNLVGAVTGALVWLALGEGLVGQLIGDLASWLPFKSGLALEDGARSNPDLLPIWGGGLVLGGYTALLLVLAWSTTVRRDVS